MDSTRLEYIDIAKGIGIILVVIGHTTNGVVCQWIYSFHMPLFLLISGFLFDIKKYPVGIKFVKKRTHQILVPCIIFTALFLIADIFFFDTSNIKLMQFNLPGALWFLPVLYLVEIIFYYITKWIKSIILQRLVILLFFPLVGYFTMRLHILNSFSISSVFPAIVFYGIGNFYSKEINNISNKYNNLYLALFLLLVPLVYVFILKSSINLSYNDIPDPVFLSYIIAIIGSLGLLLISTRIQWLFAKRMLTFLGANTLIIMGIHQLFLDFSTQFLKPVIVSHLLYKLSEQLIIWGCLFICITLINRYARWMIGKQ